MENSFFKLYKIIFIIFIMFLLFKVKNSCEKKSFLKKSLLLKLKKSINITLFIFKIIIKKSSHALFKKKIKMIKLILLIFNN